MTLKVRAEKQKSGDKQESGAADTVWKAVWMHEWFGVDGGVWIEDIGLGSTGSDLRAGVYVFRKDFGRLAKTRLTRFIPLFLTLSGFCNVPLWSNQVEASSVRRRKPIKYQMCTLYCRSHLEKHEEKVGGGSNILESLVTPFKV